MREEALEPVNAREFANEPATWRKRETGAISPDEKSIVRRLETENTGEILLANAMEQPYVRRAIRLWLRYTIR